MAGEHQTHQTHQAHQALDTHRLRLVPVTHAMKVALGQSRAALERLIGAALPAQWPQFPQAFAVGPQGPGLAPTGRWPGYLFVLRAPAQLVGNGGFVAPPGADGEVEIGYEVAPRFRNCGFATEAGQALVSHAFDHGARAVLAHSLAGPNASNAVLGKLGMRFVAELPHPRLRAVWRYRVDRPASARPRGAAPDSCPGTA